MYLDQGFHAGEEFLVNYLRQHSDDRDAWILLVTFRALFTKDEASVTSHPRHVEQLLDDPIEMQNYQLDTPFLGEQDFLEFVNSATGISAAVLRGRYSYAKYGLSRGLKDLGDLGDDDEKWLAAGEMYAQSEAHEEAIRHFTKAIKLNPQEEKAKEKLLAILAKKKRFDQIREILLEDPPKSPTNHYYWQDIKLREKDYLGMIPHLMKYSLSSYKLEEVCIALFTGSLWFLFFFHLGRGWEWKSSDKLLAIAAIILGFFSAHVCLIFVVIQDDLVGSIRADDTVFNLFYCIGAIGFREELTKLMFLVPLLSRLKSVKDNLLIITVCSFVGLGFAIEENTGYFDDGKSSTIIARFMTANFLHMALTGYSGFYLVKAIQNGGGDAWNEFGFNLLKMVVIHGIYDLLLIDSNLAGISILYMTVFIWLSQLYLRQIVGEAAILRRKVSPTRVLALVLSLVWGVSFLHAASNLGIINGFKVIIYGSLGICFIGFMFFRELGEPYH